MCARPLREWLRQVEKKTEAPTVVKQSVPTQLVIVGNALFISDLVLGGRQIGDQQKQVAQVAFNLVDWLARSPDLIAMRNKALNQRELVDKVRDVNRELVKEFREGKITLDEYRKSINEVKDDQKAQRKRWRLLNIVVPCSSILLIGLLVWMIRVGRRSMAG